MATENLQQTWEKDPSFSRIAPRYYARDAVEAATDLVLDTSQAAWVKKHWGEDRYLATENVFYRMLIISAMTAHHNLTGSDKHLPLLRQQVTGLANELDASPHGLLDDYPGQCYPTDVVAAIAAIRRADDILTPRLLSNAAHAPLLGEAAIVFQLSQRPYEGAPNIDGGSIPVCVYLMVAAYFSLGGIAVRSGWKLVRQSWH